MSCICSDCPHEATQLIHGVPKCGTHKLVITTLSEGRWLAGCHCSATLTAPAQDWPERERSQYVKLMYERHLARSDG